MQPHGFSTSNAYNPVSPPWTYGLGSLSAPLIGSIPRAILFLRLFSLFLLPSTRSCLESAFGKV